MLRKLLAIFAHPDDESMGTGGTLAKYAAEGIQTHLICATRGERGWFGPEEQNPGPGRLGQIRAQELENAVNELGMKSLHFLNYIDGEVDRANHAEAIGKIVTLLRSIQPHVVVTFPPYGNYGHPDHIAIGQFTHAAIVSAADISYKDAENLPPHRVTKLYYMVDSENFVNLILPFIDDMIFPVVDGQTRSEVAWPEWMITSRVSMAEHCQVALRAVRCHASQLPSLGVLATMDADAAVAVLAIQGTFYRAFSLVSGGRKLEADLFEGIEQTYCSMYP